MALKVVKKQKYSAKEVAMMSKEYSEISKKIKILDSTKKDLASRLKEASELIGVKDAKGSYYYDAGDFIVGKVAKKSVSLQKEETIALLKEKGLYDDCVSVEQVEVIDEKALEKAVKEGLISQEEFESLCNVKTTYSVSVQEVEELPEVDTTKSLKVASRKKN